MADYNLMSPEDMDELLFSPYRIALGEETVERIETQISNYDYYNGKQHTDGDSEELVKAEDLERPPGVDYDPTRYSTNYFKAIVDRKARWQMGGQHGVSVPRKQIDEMVDVLSENYEPSNEQKAESQRAEDYERLLYKLWDENKMRTKLIQAARDRLIADRVVCKIVFNPMTGRLHWVWVTDYEFIPIFSDDDFKDLIGANFVRYRKYSKNDEDIDALQIQRYRIEDNGMCSFEDIIYEESDLDELEVVTEKGSLGLDFIPVQIFSVGELIDDSSGQSEIGDLRALNDITNQMNEDAIDSLKFEMFEITAITNAVPGASDGFIKAPGAVAEIQSHGDTKSADIKTVSGNFRWKEAFKDQYMRVKAAMHEISGLPQVVPQELNFGGLNGEALQVLYHDIITDTEEHWLSWGYGLAELHEKSVKYLQAMTGESNFAYDKEVVRNIGEDYTNEMRFVLPLPDNRKELVELLDAESAAGFESTKGAIERLGVENVQAKLQEIESERSRKRNSSATSYGVDVDETEDNIDNEAEEDAETTEGGDD